MKESIIRQNVGQRSDIKEGDLYLNTTLEQDTYYHFVIKVDKDGFYAMFPNDEGNKIRYYHFKNLLDYFYSSEVWTKV